MCSNLRRLEEAGARLIFFSPLADGLPTGISGLYLGGGYPERHAEALAANRQLRAAVRAFANAGGVVYAECGGMIYLSHSLQSVDGLSAEMGASMCVPRNRLVHEGFIICSSLQACPCLASAECLLRSGRVRLPFPHDQTDEDGLRRSGNAAGLQFVSSWHQSTGSRLPLF